MRVSLGWAQYPLGLGGRGANATENEKRRPIGSERYETQERGGGGGEEERGEREDVQETSVREIACQLKEAATRNQRLCVWLVATER